MNTSTTATRSRSGAGHASTELTDDQRLRCISDAAYYRALARGFAPGNEMADWLEAEADFDAAQSVHPHRHASAGS